MTRSHTDISVGLKSISARWKAAEVALPSARAKPRRLGSGVQSYLSAVGSRVAHSPDFPLYGCRSSLRARRGPDMAEAERCRESTARTVFFAQSINASGQEVSEE